MSSFTKFYLIKCTQTSRKCAILVIKKLTIFSEKRWLKHFRNTLKILSLQYVLDTFINSCGFFFPQDKWLIIFRAITRLELLQTIMNTNHFISFAKYTRNNLLLLLLLMMRMVLKQVLQLWWEGNGHNY